MAKRWQPRNPDLDLKTSVAALRSALTSTTLDPVTLAVCVQRGFQDAESLSRALQPSLANLTSPWTVEDMAVAVDRLVQARAASEKVVVFSDYDVDGTCGGALLGCALREMGFHVHNIQPDRFKDGYGLSETGVHAARDAGASVLITVDCGITSFDAIAAAGRLALDVIVVDHHQIDPARGIPSALAVLDPHRADCASGLKELCGCGLAFYLAMALRSKGRELGWFASAAEPNLKKYLDLVVLATAADQVPMRGDNRILVRHGMTMLRQSERPGMLALLEAAGVQKREITPSHLGFVLGPRINASGRLSHASMAMELLSTKDPKRARELAQAIEKLNRERMDLQNAIWDEVRKKVDAGLATGRFAHSVVVGDATWHEGVVGIVASRVVETYGKPAVVISHGKGSVRSTRGIDVLQALRDSAVFLKGFGGHRFAAGLSLDLAQLDGFAQAFDDAVRLQVESGRVHVEEILSLDAVVEPIQIQWPLMIELNEMGPWGPSYPEPVIALSSRVLSYRVMKDRHLKVELEAGLEGVWFHTPESPETLGQRLLQSEQPHWWAGVPEINHFMGRASRVLRVKDVRPTMDPALLASLQMTPSESFHPLASSLSVSAPALSG